MKKYIGIKKVKAEPMTLGEFKKQNKVTDTKNNNTEGSDGYMVIYKDGYTSWSPKDVFDEAYTEIVD